MKKISICLMSIAIFLASNTFAAIQFLPDAQEKEFNFAGNNLKNNYNTGTCEGYNYTVFNCSKPKDVASPCPFNQRMYKECRCDSNVYKYTAQNCSYRAEAPFTSDNNRLLADFCQDSASKPLMAKECHCKYFRFTTNNSCGDANMIVDTRSSCQENGGEVRYETCRCNPAIFPYLYVGSFRSQDFLANVKANCGHSENFISCQNFDKEVAYKCAVDVAYKYDDEICKQINSTYSAAGVSQTFTNGYGDRVTLYQECK